jgi:hypothetical protein
VGLGILQLQADVVVVFDSWWWEHNGGVFGGGAVALVCLHEGWWEFSWFLVGLFVVIWFVSILVASVKKGEGQ